MKYLPNIHTSTITILSIFAGLSFYYSGKEEQKQRTRNEVNAILALSCIEPVIETKPSKIILEKSRFKIYKTPAEALKDNDFSKTVDRVLSNKI
jgi:hypothetical protein